ncbi:MAG: type I-U CRISPR-associated protein Csx17, partial [Pseudomonadota bacterium]
MTMHIHDLNGCAPVPLAHYLKALGILRLVAEQVDPEARGWWEGERFRLMSKLDKAELEVFFLERYTPTPLVAPWNGGTGFYPKDKKAGKAVRGILAKKSHRFLNYQEAIKSAQKLISSRVEPPDKKDKPDFLRICLRDWRGGQREAMAAAVVLGSDDVPGYPSLFGTGFNDGRLDFTSNFMGRLLELFPSEGHTSLTAIELLKDALCKNSAPHFGSRPAGRQCLPAVPAQREDHTFGNVPQEGQRGPDRLPLCQARNGSDGPVAANRFPGW